MLQAACRETRPQNSFSTGLPAWFSKPVAGSLARQWWQTGTRGDGEASPQEVQGWGKNMPARSSIQWREKEDMWRISAGTKNPLRRLVYNVNGYTNQKSNR
jgi:hypothetical protein